MHEDFLIELPLRDGSGREPSGEIPRYGEFALGDRKFCHRHDEGLPGILPRQRANREETGFEF